MMGNLRQKISKHDTIFNRLVLSFIALVLLVCICMCAGYAIQFTRKYREKVEILEKEKLEYLGGRMDTLFGECNSIIIDLANMGNRDDAINSFLTHATANDYDNMSTVLKYLEIINAQYDKEVSGVDFYIFSNNMLVSSSTGISFFELSGAELTEGLDNRGVAVKYNASNRYIFKRTVVSNSNSTEVLSFGAHYPIFAKELSKVKGYMVVNVPVAYLNRMMDEYVDDNLGYAALVDEEGRVVAQGGDEELYSVVLGNMTDQERIEAIESAVSSTYNRSNHILLGQNTEIDGWKVISITSAGEYYKETDELVRMMVLWAVGITAVGLFLAFRFAKKLYKPFDTMVSKLNRNAGRRAKENELLYMDRAISELMAQAGNKDEARQDRVNDIHRELMRKLVNSSDISEETVENMLADIGDTTEYACHYCVAVTLPERVLKKLDEATRNATTYNYTRYLESYTEAQARCMVLNLYSGRVLALVSFEREKQGQLAVLRNKFTDWAKMNLGLDTVMINSSAIYRLSDAHVTFSQLFKVMDYMYFIPYRYKIDLAELSHEELAMLLGDKDTPSFFDPKYDSFSEALVSQDRDALKQILTEFNEAASEIRGTFEYMNSVAMRYLFLFNHFLRDFMKKAKDYDDSQLFLEFNEVFDVDDFCTWLYNKILWAFEHTNRSSETPTDNVVSLVERIVREHLAEDISLEYVAKKVYLAPKYLSRLFKEEMGVNFTQYVNDCKMKEAEKLLAETEMTLEDIIVQVGFNSTNYFIKKFKETYGCTPAQYRRNKRIDVE